MFKGRIIVYPLGSKILYQTNWKEVKWLPQRDYEGELAISPASEWVAGTDMHVVRRMEEKMVPVS